MWSRILYRIRSISLIWKLLIPFLTFAFIGTTSLVYLGLNSQKTLIAEENTREMNKLYRLFCYDIKQKGMEVLGMASVIAEDREVKKFMADRKREDLDAYSAPIFRVLKERFGVEQFHFHIPPGRSFLRLHRESKQGEMMAYRRTIMEAMKTGSGVSGLEWGRTGLGIRGVAPIFRGGRLLGSVEIGHPFDTQFLGDLKREWGADFAIYEKRGKGDYVPLAGTARKCMNGFTARYLQGLKGPEPRIFVAPEGCSDRAILLGPLKDYYGDVVAVVLISVDRSGIVKRLQERRNLMLFIALSGIFVSFGLTWLVAVRFVKPIREIVIEAREIASEGRESRLKARPDDEVGDLTRSLNAMLGALKERRIKIEEYAKNLEGKVRDRTADLVTSEERYRTFVETVPLIVYRLLNDGTTEFINPYFTEKLGYTAEEVVGDRDFWREKICGEGDAKEKEILKACWGKSGEYRKERVVFTKDGQPLTFIDQVIPFVNNGGMIRWIDGIMMDITQLKAYQERALQTEEIKVISEISARLAHEIRNPLTTAGGFALRILKNLPEGDPNRASCDIIVQEVARLEDILRIILSSIEPITLRVDNVNMGSLLDGILEKYSEELSSKGVRLETSIPQTMTQIRGDEELLSKAIENLIGYATLTASENGEFHVSLEGEKERVFIHISYTVEGLSDEDLDQFFLPRLPHKLPSKALDLPLSKIIIYKHGGKIDVARKDKNMISVGLELPIRWSGFRI